MGLSHVHFYLSIDYASSTSTDVYVVVGDFVAQAGGSGLYFVDGGATRTTNLLITTQHILIENVLNK